MRVGIITYHSTRNCGAVLQSYALNKVVSDLGYKCEIIDYKCENIEKAYKIKKIYELRSIKEFIKWGLLVHTQKKSQKEFDKFTKENLKISRVYNKDNITDANKEFDAFITGSDQVWNFNLNGADENYILNFAKEDKIKLSYAASLGYKTIPKNYTHIFKENLTTFNAISVREEEGLESLKELGHNSELVLDPTLLLKKEDYYKFVNHNKNGDYIFVYTVANTPNIYKKALELSEKTGYPVIWAHMNFMNKKGVLNLKNPSCIEFLTLLNNAKYVLTSSFHGMALSIVLNKEFFYDLSVSPNNHNSRLTTLASSLSLTEREMKENKELSINEKIDYEKIEQLLNEKRRESIDFLIKGLGK
ncbi:MAG: polysaccharide pyruvyl transferase family protein [Clostridia bacterium]|nr:polysaccharide pyruvyl transferase family protein [Clostridia bacterium]